MKSALIIGGTVVAIIAAISLWPETPVAEVGQRVLRSVERIFGLQQCQIPINTKR